MDVLGWVRGRAVAPERRQRLFGRVQGLRTVHPYGVDSLQRVSIDAEPGLSRHRGAVWIEEGQRRSAYRATRIARYRGAYAQRQKPLRAGRHPRGYHTVCASPPLALLALDDAPWIKGQPRALQRRTPRRTTRGEQRMVAGWGTSALLCFYLQVVGEVGRNCFPYMSCVM